MRCGWGLFPISFGEASERVRCCAVMAFLAPGVPEELPRDRRPLRDQKYVSKKLKKCVY